MARLQDPPGPWIYPIEFKDLEQQYRAIAAKSEPEMANGLKISQDGSNGTVRIADGFLKVPYGSGFEVQRIESAHSHNLHDRSDRDHHGFSPNHIFLEFEVKTSHPNVVVGDLLEDPQETEQSIARGIFMKDFLFLDPQSAACPLSDLLQRLHAFTASLPRLDSEKAEIISYNLNKTTAAHHPRRPSSGPFQSVYSFSSPKHTKRTKKWECQLIFSSDFFMERSFDS